MRERPILFSGAMVRAILAGTKTQTRRIVKAQRHPFGEMHTPEQVANEFAAGTCAFRCPYGQTGDRLWVRETFQRFTDDGEVIYRADPKSFHLMNDLKRDECLEARWRPAIHMPRWASRITLKITGVRAERLKSITISDAMAEGYDGSFAGPIDPSIKWYSKLWETINGPGSWDANPWVWVVEFRRLDYA